MNNWIKLSNEEFIKSKEIIGLKKGELQIKLVKSLVVLDKIKDYAEKYKIIGVIAPEENEYMKHILELLEEIK